MADERLIAQGLDALEGLIGLLLEETLEPFAHGQG
jgi:hypothetical protein